MTLPESIAPVPIVEICSITKQTPFAVGIFDFNKGRQPGTDYFNSGLVLRPDGGTWLIARRSKWEKREDFGYNDIMAFELDDVRPVIGRKVHMGQQFPHEHFEDPRAVVHDGRVFVSACNFIRHKVHGRDSMTYPHQIISEVDSEWRLVNRYDPVYGKNGRDAGANTGHEKNWNYFHQNGIWHMVYGATPHQVVPFTNDFKTLAVLNPSLKTSHASDVKPIGPDTVPCWETKWDSSVWKYGLIRGGTPPVLVDGEYLTFFHSSTKWSEDKRQYHMGVYTFEAKPPFRITKITLDPLLSGSRYDRWYPSKPPCVFPTGTILRNGTWLITGGCNDIDCFWMKLPHEALVDRLVNL